MKNKAFFQGRVGVPRRPDAAAQRPYHKLVQLARCFILLPLALRLRASGQSYSINWYKVAGGSGNTAGVSRLPPAAAPGPA